jgi:hypothetical protein
LELITTNISGLKYSADKADERYSVREKATEGGLPTAAKSRPFDGNLSGSRPVQVKD